MRRPERRLQDSEALYETVLADAPFGIVLVNQDLRLAEVNEAFCRMLGFKREELTGIPISEITHPEDVDRDLRNAQKLLAGEIPNYRLEKRYLTKNREVIWAMLTAAPIRDREGNLLYGLGIIENISDRKQADKKLEEQTAYLKALIENSPLSIVVLDSQHQVQMCNPAFERLFLYRQSEVVGINLDQLVATPEGLSESLELTRRVLAGECTHAEGHRRRKDGTLVEVEINGVPLLVNGKQIGVYGLYQDITERKQAERSLRQLSGRLLRLQDEERRRMARELHDTTGQSLAAISMYLGVIHNFSEQLGLEARRALSKGLALAEQCEQEIRTISYLLHPPLLDDVGLVPALRWYTAGFSERSGIRVDLYMPPELGRLPRDTETTMFRIVQECLTNIHRHSGSSTAEIRIDVQTNCVLLEVKDMGHGMPGRLPEKTGGAMARLGVGIAGMHERAKQLRGRLEVVSSNLGTTIRVILPLGDAEP